MTEFQGAPAYLQLADDLRERIRSGKLAAGTALPSTQELMDSSGVSSTVVKNAVSLLRTEGYVIGHQGKGVFAQFPPRLAGHSRGAADWAVPVLQAGQAIEQALRDLVHTGGEGADAEAALQRWQAAFEALPDSVKSRLAE
ncbi:winged helix-turn-helix domain-containing protein [Streptomyces sp. NRRL S-350]|uniref:winged helix-turn-helix domain-containing protein n=1 Tax=Streptomyces sp. NRRL S-350 TaxID=1463902 RepID=UPI0007C4C75F|nr:winged helix-turn-helix domain-containing protein [Streptomyces sp. NRRL S-350]